MNNKESYTFKISRLDSTRSINGRMPNSLEMAGDSSSRVIAFLWSLGSLGWINTKGEAVISPKDGVPTRF